MALRPFRFRHCLQSKVEVVKGSPVTSGGGPLTVTSLVSCSSDYMTGNETSARHKVLGDVVRRMASITMKGGVLVVLGGQWGDEGKGKLVDILAQDADLVCRCNGGNNAGHTVKVGSAVYDFHILPSGIINPECKSIIGNGVVVHLPGLFAEIEKNEVKGLKNWQERLLISSRAHLVFDFHQKIDALLEEEKAKTKSNLGTTKKGIGPTYAAKSSRQGLRVCDLYARPQVLEEKLRSMVTGYQIRFPTLKVDIEAELKRYKEYAERIRPMVCDTVLFVNKAIKEQKKVIVEGANAAMLDIDFGLGVPPRDVHRVYGVVKAYSTRVGEGAFPTELKDDLGDKLREIGHEYGVTTGRPRRCGWFDVTVVKYSSMVSGYSSICLTKLDCLDTFEEIKIGVSYKLDGKILESLPAEQSELECVEVEYITMPGWKTSIAHKSSFADLPPNAQAYVRKLEELVGVQIQWIGTGPSRDDMIQLFE